MKTINQLELELVITIKYKDEETLREIGFNFERSSESLLEEFFHNTAEQIRFSKKLKGL